MKETARRLLKRLDNLDDPELRRLQSDAKEHVEEVAHAAGLFPDEHAIRRLSYTYYYDWETDDPDFMLLVQNPGNLHKRHLEELQPENPLEGGCTRREQAHIYRQFAKSWLTGRNADFSETFFGRFDDHGLIDLGTDWEDYLDTARMFQDFYLGDAVKYRIDGLDRSAERISYDTFFEREIEALDPDLLIHSAAMPGMPYDERRSRRQSRIQLKQRGKSRRFTGRSTRLRTLSIRSFFR